MTKEIIIDQKEFGKRLEKILEEKKITNKQIATDLKINKNAIGNYKNGQIPNAVILYSISAYLGISIEFLLTGKSSPELSLDEQQLIDFYRSADFRGKRAILRTAELENQELTSSASRTGSTGTDNKFIH